MPEPPSLARVEMMGGALPGGLSENKNVEQK